MVCSVIQTLLWEISLNYCSKTKERLNVCLSTVKCWDGNKQNSGHCFSLCLFPCFLQIPQQQKWKMSPSPRVGGIHVGQSPSQHHCLCPQLCICHMAITILNRDSRTHGCHSILIVSSNTPFLFLELYFNDVARHCSFKVQTFSTKQPLCIIKLNPFLYNKNSNALLQYYHKVTKHK